MRNENIEQLVSQLRGWLVDKGYSESYIRHFNSTAFQLIKFMSSKGIADYTIMIGIDFLKEQYQYDLKEKMSKINSRRLRYLQMLSEYQMYRTIVVKARIRKYKVPLGSKSATDEFILHRQYIGITEKGIQINQLYLERFFDYLSSQNITEPAQISINHIHGYLKFIAQYSKQTGNSMLRTVRQFLSFCYQNDYRYNDLAKLVPSIYFDKRSNIPSAYSQDDVMKLLAQVDRNNPIGKRNYAILLLTAKLGIRAGDICNLKFENLDWEQNKVSWTQHKTGKPIILPLLEDVGLAIIDYLKFGRPECESPHIFIRHRAPITHFLSNNLFNMVSTYVGKAGLLAQCKKRGPHALRHSLASRLLEENVPLPIISEILGHADTETTAIYLSIDINRLRICALEVC